MRIKALTKIGDKQSFYLYEIFFAANFQAVLYTCSHSPAIFLLSACAQFLIFPIQRFVCANLLVHSLAVYMLVHFLILSDYSVYWVKLGKNHIYIIIIIVMIKKIQIKL